MSPASYGSGMETDGDFAGYGSHPRHCSEGDGWTQACRNEHPFGSLKNFKSKGIWWLGTRFKIIMACAVKLRKPGVLRSSKRSSVMAGGGQGLLVASVPQVLLQGFPC